MLTFVTAMSRPVALLTVFSLVALGLCGCTNQPAPAATAADPQTTNEPAIATPDARGPAITNGQQVSFAAPQAPAAQESDPNSGSESSLLDDAARLLRRAGESGQDGASSVAEWVSNRATDSADLAVDSADWVGDLFNSLKDRGLTTADNANQWVREDFRAMGGWEYKIVSGELDEKAMNLLGADRWECFHVQQVNADLKLFFKRPRRSYLRSIPMKDLIKLMPLVNQDE